MINRKSDFTQWVEQHNLGKGNLSDDIEGSKGWAWNIDLSIPLEVRVITRLTILTWEAPLLLPDWSPMTPSRPWRICSSEKFLSFLVAILGPREGPVYSGWFWVARPATNLIHHHHLIVLGLNQRVSVRWLLANFYTILLIILFVWRQFTAIPEWFWMRTEQVNAKTEQ